MNDAWRRGLKISFVIGVIVQRDAISNICMQQVDALIRHARRNRYPLSIKIYTTSSQVPDPRIAAVADFASIIDDAHFLESDVVVFHFGIYTPLFDAIHFAGPMTRKLVYLHGITSPMLVHAEQRPVLFRSYEQVVNLHAADRVLVTSRYLMRELERMGLARENMVQTPPAISFPIPAVPTPPRQLVNSDLRLVYVGRFVRAKGVLDLLGGLAAFRHKIRQPFQLDLVGSKTFSDPEYVEQLLEQVRQSGLSDSVHWHFDAPNSLLTKVLGEAHTLVNPSYHEGFCVPVLEAFACGCFVICSDAGALPETSHGLGRTFRMADPESLADCLAEFVAARRCGGFLTDRGVLPDETWAIRARAYVADLSPARSDERFCTAVLEPVQAHDVEVRQLLAERRRQLINELRSKPLDTPRRAGDEVDAGICTTEAA
jgi:glycosyltransferase involved in cell wall biosynthesis